jgi:hypothetical protein
MKRFGRHAAWAWVVSTALSGCGGSEAAAPVTVASISLTAPQITIASGASLQVSATVMGSNGMALTDRVITWSTSNAGVASVGSSGLVTAASVRGGASEPVTITATSEGRPGSLQLQVLPVPIATLTMSAASAAVRVGEQLQLTVTARGADQVPLSGRTLSWSSTQPNVASVDANGLVRAVSTGVARIEARAEGATAFADITVPAVPTLNLTVSAASVVQRGDQVTVAWQAVNVTTCEASGSWLGARAVTGTSTITLDSTGVHTFSLRCTGAGGEVMRQASVTARRPVSRQSYDNFKDNGVVPSSLPAFFGTTGYGDFFGTGTSALFTAELRYDARKPIEQAMRSLSSWWTMRADRTWQRMTMPVIEEVPTCVHPRKVLVTEFNGDRRPDLVMLCHGHDAPPFRGELNLSLVSQPDGSYRQRALSPDSAFFHGGATCELDGDDGLELITADGQQLRVHDVLPDGTTQYRASHPVSGIGGVGRGGLYSVECLDVDEDGHADVVFGGHEPGMPHFTTPTRIWFGQPGGTYREVVIPAVPNEAVVLDFTVTGSGASRTLWVLRTSGGDGTAYVGNTLQRVHIPTMTSSVAFSSRDVVQLGWLVPYMRNGSLYLGAESSGLQPGPEGRTGWEYRVP